MDRLTQVVQPYSKRLLHSSACVLVLALLAASATTAALAQQTATAPTSTQPTAPVSATGAPVARSATTPAAPASAATVPASTATVKVVAAAKAETPPAQATALPAATPPKPVINPTTGAPLSSFAGANPAPLKEIASAEVPAKSDGLAQGMKVHGHWVIDVKNPDGTLASHNEFENSLETSAQGFMVGLLSGYMVPGDWMVVLGAQSGAGPCNGPSYQFCGIVRSAATFPAQGYCNLYYCTGSTLAYGYNFGTGFAGPFSIVLTGSITSNQTGTVGSVFTLLNLCANTPFSTGVNPSGIETSSPASCVAQTAPATWYGPFTQANITPIAVTSGQLVQVIVTLTFS
jgi:hypothetical protein